MGEDERVGAYQPYGSSPKDAFFFETTMMLFSRPWAAVLAHILCRHGLVVRRGPTLHNGQFIRLNIYLLH